MVSLFIKLRLLWQYLEGMELRGHLNSEFLPGKISSLVFMKDKIILNDSSL